MRSKLCPKMLNEGEIHRLKYPFHCKYIDHIEKCDNSGQLEKKFSVIDELKITLEANASNSLPLSDSVIQSIAASSLFQLSFG